MIGSIASFFTKKKFKLFTLMINETNMEKLQKKIFLNQYSKIYILNVL